MVAASSAAPSGFGKQCPQKNPFDGTSAQPDFWPVNTGALRGGQTDRLFIGASKRIGSSARGKDRHRQSFMQATRTARMIQMAVSQKNTRDLHRLDLVTFKLGQNTTSVQTYSRIDQEITESTAHSVHIAVVRVTERTAQVATCEQIDAPRNLHGPRFRADG